jgi:hypothetical protein
MATLDDLGIDMRILLKFILNIQILMVTLCTSTFSIKKILLSAL